MIKGGIKYKISNAIDGRCIFEQPFNSNENSRKQNNIKTIKTDIK